MMVHLVLAALGGVAVEAQSLVGHELPAARVHSGTNGNTVGTTSVQRERESKCAMPDDDEWGMRKFMQILRGIGRASEFRQKTYPRTRANRPKTVRDRTHSLSS